MNKVVKRVIGITLVSTFFFSVTPTFASPNPQVSPVAPVEPLTPVQQIEVLDLKIQEISTKIIESMDKVDKLTAEVDKGKEKAGILREEVAEAEKDYAFTLDLTQNRLRLIQKNGGSSSKIYLDILVSSRGLTDFLNKANAVNTILQSDIALTKDLNKKEKSLKKKEKELKSELDMLVTLKESAELEKLAIEQEKVNVMAELKRVEELQKQFLIKQEFDRLKQEEMARRALEAIANEQARLATLASLTTDDDIPDFQGGYINHNPNATMTYQDVADVDSEVAKAVIMEMSKYLGVPYLWGGMTPEGFDCSGLMQYAFKNIGIELPRVSRDQQNFGVRIPLSEIQPGDLIFINEPATHVAMYIGNNQYMHTPKPGDVAKISNYNPKYWTTATRVILK